MSEDEKVDLSEMAAIAFVAMRESRSYPPHVESVTITQMAFMIGIILGEVQGKNPYMTPYCYAAGKVILMMIKQNNNPREIADMIWGDL